MIKFLFSLSIPFLLFISMPARAQDCSCADAFEQVVQVYEKDYSLFNIKVTDQNRELYNANKAVFRAKAKAVNEVENCLPVLEQWLQFFRDGHNNIKFTGHRGQKDTRERIAMDRATFLTDLKRNRKKKPYKGNDLLGIWKYGSYEVGIMPNPKKSTLKRDFVGVVLSSKNPQWKPGDVRFELNHVYGNDYQAVYYQDDNGGRKLKGKLQNPTTLEFLTNNTWTKVWPTSKDTKAAVAAGTDLYSDFHFKLVDGEIPYLRFPNFYEKEPAFVDSLLKAHHQELIKAPFIIVDVRDNNGGNDVVYKPLLPYLLSGSIQIPNSGIWMSEENLKIFLEGKNPENFNEEEKAEYNYLMSLKNTFFWTDKDKYAYTLTPDTLYAPHQKVAVLMNGKTISSGETFVFKARQSDKVILYGQNTAGVVDGYNVLTKSIGCFNLRYPSSLRAKDVAKNPIDPYGMAPNVFVSPELDALDLSIQHMRQLLKIQ